MEQIAAFTQAHPADDAFELLKEKLDPSLAEQDDHGRYVLGDYDDMVEMLEAVEEIEAACIEFARSVSETAARIEKLFAIAASLLARNSELEIEFQKAVREVSVGQLN